MGRKQLGCFGGSGDRERWVQQQLHREENFVPQKGSGAGPSRRRPPLRSLTVTSLCARAVHPAASARGASRRGPCAGLGSPPACRRSARTPSWDRSASIAPKGRRRPAVLRIPAGRQPSRNTRRGSLSRRQPGSPQVAQAQRVLEAWGPRGRPSFVRSAGRREADTYRTPQRGKARATPTPAAETPLCSSDGPYPRQMEGARRWRRRRRRSWGQTPPPPSPWLLPARSAAAEGEGRDRPRALPPAGPASAARTPSGPAFPGAGTRNARSCGKRQGRRLRGSGLAPHNQPAPPPARLSASRHRRSSVHSAIPWPACFGSRPALPWTRPSSRRFRRSWCPSSEAVPIDVRAHEPSRPLGSRGTGTGG